MKRLGLFVLALSLSSLTMAQDLEVHTINDQFDVGTRGNAIGSGGSGGANRNGTEFLDYTGTDATATPTTGIRYINSWGTALAVPESPVLTVTAPFANPDRVDAGTGGPQTIPAIPVPNNRPGAIDGNKAVVIGDDGGFNALFFGNSDDSDYYVEVDLWCPGLSVGATFTPPAPFEVAGISVRAGRDNQVVPPGTSYNYLNMYGEGTYSPDRTPAYGLYYDYQKQAVSAVRWKLSNSSTQITNRDTSASVLLGSLSNVAQGWHTMRVECRDQNVTFKFDGAVIAAITNSVTFIHPTDPTQTTFDYGRPCIYYRENTVTNPNEKQAIFDNLRAGPTPPNSSADDWNLY